MIIKKISLFAIFLFLTSFISLAAFCEDMDNNTSSSENIKTLNNIIIDTVKKEIRINCQLAITQGILEFFLVAEEGNTYESIFKVKSNKPSELHFALLLLGFEAIPFKTYNDLLKNENALTELKNKKCLLTCTILKDNKEIPLSSIIQNREKDNNQPPIWIFTGASFTKDNKYTADYSYSYINIWPMPDTVINLLSSAGNPYRGEFGYEISKDLSFLKEDNFIIVIKEWNNE